MLAIAKKFETQGRLDAAQRLYSHAARRNPKLAAARERSVFLASMRKQIATGKAPTLVASSKGDSAENISTKNDSLLGGIEQIAGAGFASQNKPVSLHASAPAKQKKPKSAVEAGLQHVDWISEAGSAAFRPTEVGQKLPTKKPATVRPVAHLES